MAEMSVGVRELKARLSEYLRAVKDGQTVVITEHGKEVARLSPVAQSLDERLQALVTAGLAEWSGKSLPPVPHKPRVRGKKTVADMLIEDRE
jgi:prevent-host-death family protein